MSRDHPRVLDIPSGAPFLDTLVKAVLEDGFPGSAPPSKAELSRYTILVPSRRAAGDLADAFLRVGDGEALLLPNIRPLGDVEEEELAFFEAADPATLEIPPTLSPLKRQLLLARLLLDWANANPSAAFAQALLPGPVEAVRVARGLGRLLDQMETDEVSPAGFERLVAEDHALYWQDVLQVLSLIRTELPDAMDRLGVVGSSMRRGLLLRAEAERLETLRPETPFIAAGSTGSIPATAELLSVIARLPAGAVVLPGLDRDLDDASWRELDAQHPQYNLHNLLNVLGTTREEVETLGPGGPGRDARRRLLSEIMRPSETTELWHGRLAGLEPEMDAAMAGLSLIRAPTRRDEALAIAIAMREAVETPERTAALITPDRDLGRQVSSHLNRWGLDVYDSAGISLSHTVPGIFMNLVLDVLSERFSPESLVALLAHPLTRLGRPPGEVAGDARRLELAVWRGVPPSTDVADLADMLARRRGEVERNPRWHPILAGWSPRDWERVGTLAAEIPAAFRPFLDAMDDGTPLRLDVAAAMLVRVAEDIARDEDGERSPLWHGEAGDRLSRLLAELVEPDEHRLEVAVADLGAVVMELMEQSVVRPRHGTHPRLRILGQLEARLSRHDVVILGGMNEGTWPAKTQTDPWLNRPMRAELGFSSPELRMGLSAHDFVQAAASEGDVFLSHSEKLDGAPAVASRWLLRLEAVTSALGIGDLHGAGDRLLRLAAGLDAVETVEPVQRPAPRPGLDLRPRRLSVTEIETWLRDPYAIFARHVLKLRPLEPLNPSPGPREQGLLFHDVFEEFATSHRETLPPDVAGELVELASRHFDRWTGHPEVSAFWRLRMERVAEAAAAIETRLRETVAELHVEERGELTVAAGTGHEFVLTGRADRIDVLADGTARIIDYKTGMPPGNDEALSGKSPQLLLEAMMLMRGAFAGVSAGGVSELLYLRLSGGDPPIEVRPLRPSSGASVEDVCRQVYGRFEEFIRRYLTDPEQPYLPRTMPRNVNVELPYDHLSRYGEWIHQVPAEDAGP